MATETNIADLESLCVNALRFLAVDAVEKANSGHPGTPMEAAALGHVLWTKLLRHNPQNPAWANRDRFVLSCGHASALLYGLLHLTGYAVTLEDIQQFRQWGSRTPGHPEHGHTAGVETTTGPLGQGFATGVGMAIAARHLAARFNRPDFPIVDHRVWAFVSDGDVMEGLSSEAASLAGHLRLSALKYVYLDNRITIEGGTDLAFSEDVEARFVAQGWRVFRLANAENLFEVRAVLEKALAENEKPTLVIARTHIGYGAPNKQDTAKAHGEPLGAAETLLAKQKLGWPTESAFHVPPAVDRHRALVRERGAALEKEWNDLLGRYRSAHPDLAAHWDAVSTHGPLPAHWENAVPAFGPADAMATRQASGKSLNAVAKVVPSLLGGSADLGPSNNSRIEGDRSFTAQTPEGRNLHFGIREHAMGAILNGMALSGRLIPYGATFLTFADYMRPAIRLAALMKLGVIYIFTHDSVGVGEDGPTHQPIEHLASLRAIPGLVVLRPADANETAQAWRIALERRDGPTALVLSRQKLPMVTTGKASTLRGAYRLFGDDAEVLLLASGSEVSLAVKAREALAAQNVRADVVSVPSWELFWSQDAAYRNAVLPPAVSARVAIEAGVSQGWHRFIGDKGTLVTVDRFGASAPGDVVMEKLGFTADRVVRAALEAMGRTA
jgi:transketolase